MIAEDQGFFGAELFVDDGRFLVRHTDFVAFGYAFARHGSNKPYVSSLVGPSGRNMLEVHPPDHAHHRGIWWGHGDVNGVDYYLELPVVGEDHPLGSIVHLGFDLIVDDAPRFGFVERLEWREPSGVVALRERRAVQYDVGAADRAVLDLESTYGAVVDLAFGDTKESVLPGVRLAERLTTNGGGRMVNSRGGVAEAECFGQPAEWVDHTATRSGVYWQERTEGLAILDHPSNAHHPPTWFTRDYGPQCSFQGHHFTGPATMAAGETLTARHRIVVHVGDVEAAGVAAAFDAYAATDGRVLAGAGERLRPYG